jgi:hypothetical protein
MVACILSEHILHQGFSFYDCFVSIWLSGIVVAQGFFFLMTGLKNFEKTLNPPLYLRYYYE